jgi:hypothetical protein
MREGRDGEHPHLEHGSTAAPAGRQAVKMAFRKAVLSQEIGWDTIDAQDARAYALCRCVAEHGFRLAAAAAWLVSRVAAWWRLLLVGSCL